MDLHLHLSVAFRALDRKWGTPVDLDVLDSSLDTPCQPAVIDADTCTFSSDEFLKTIRRQKKCNIENERRKIERADSFSNISMSRIPSISDLDSANSDEESPRTDSPCSSGYGGSCDNLDDFVQDVQGYNPNEEKFEESPVINGKRWRLPKMLKSIKNRSLMLVRRKS